MDEQVEEILQLLNNSSNNTKNTMELKRLLVDCPECEEKARISFNINEFNNLKMENGLANIIVELPCNHFFLMHVDKEFRIRGYIKINDAIHVVSEKIDVKYLREMESRLRIYHDKLIVDDPRDPRAYKIFQELGNIRKKIDKLSRNIKN